MQRERDSRNRIVFVKVIKNKYGYFKKYAYTCLMKNIYQDERDENVNKYYWYLCLIKTYQKSC